MKTRHSLFSLRCEDITRVGRGDTRVATCSLVRSTRDPTAGGQRSRSLHRFCRAPWPDARARLVVGGGWHFQHFFSTFSALVSGQWCVRRALSMGRER